MNHKYAKQAAACCYIVAVIIMIYYMSIKLNSEVIFGQRKRLKLLFSICIIIYIGSMFLLPVIKEQGKNRVMKVTFAVFFFLYLFILSDLLFFDVLYDRAPLPGTPVRKTPPLKEYAKKSTNLIPFKTVWYYAAGFRNGTLGTYTVIVNLLGNIVAFAPFGLFVPLLFQKTKKFSRFLVVAILCPLLVEVTQVLMRVGDGDIDDVILNAAGACLVYWFLHVKWIRKWVVRFTRLDY